MARRSARQTNLRFRTWGGRRAGSGRKRAASRIGLLPHQSRPPVDARVPVHVTLRAVRASPNLRTQRVAAVVVDEIRRASTKGFRLLHFSIQENHLHVIAEADDGVALSRGVQRLASRIARRLNLLVARHGRLWRERYHRRDLPTPRQFRNALVYVIFNFRKHAHGAERRRRMTVLDGLSSAFWLDAWASRDTLALVRSARAGPAPVSRARTWLASRGWHRAGLLRPWETPALPG